jgi:3-deoxy-7-phosphoheptulonate synthase
MIVVMSEQASADDIQGVETRLAELGCSVHRSQSAGHVILGGVGPSTVDSQDLTSLGGVREVIRLSAPYKLAARAFKPEGTRFDVGDVEIGGAEVVVMAGPCTVENEEQVESVAALLARLGVKIMRGGAFKPRTSPYSFQGHGELGLKMLRTAAQRHGLLVVSEVMDAAHLDLACDYVDIVQVGARNMQNFSLLKAVAKANKPVLLKRGPAATIEETLLSAEYLLSGGNPRIVLCERGIRTFETATRNTLDLSAIPVLKALSHLPVIADPSHGTGRREAVVPMARAAIAAGADGLLLEVHPKPELALCDGAQSLLPDQLDTLLTQLRAIAPIVDRRL